MPFPLVVPFLVFGAGAALGALFIGGTAETHETLTNDINQEITTNLESEVDASNNIRCQNNQIIEGVDVNCPIRFAQQTCNAESTVTVMVDQDFQNDLRQKTVNKFLSETLNEVSGLNFAQSSEVSKTVNNLVNMSLDMTGNMSTTCAQDVNAVNNQVFRGTEHGNSCNAQNGSVTFAVQNATVTNVSSCTVNQIQQNQAFQDLQNELTVKTTNKVKGIDLLDLLLPLILMFVIFFVGFKLITGLLKPKGNQDSGSGKAASTGLIIIFLIILLWLLFFWPGTGKLSYAGNQGIWPHTSNFVRHNGDNFCPNGRDYPQDDKINKFIWYDELCSAAPEGAPCSPGPGNNPKFYAGCGLFGGGCDDPNFNTDRNRFENMIQACNKVSLVSSNTRVGDAEPVQLEACERSLIAAQNFAQVIVAGDTPYSGCKLCSGSDANDTVNQFYVREGADCSTAQINPLQYYMDPTQTDTNVSCSTQVASFPQFTDESLFCNAGQDDADWDTYRNSTGNVDDCRNSAYQLAKANVSRQIRACEEATSIYQSAVPDANNPTIREMCPPFPYTFFDCDRATQECNYTAINPDLQKSCSNELNSPDDCGNADFLKDYDDWSRLNESCKQINKRDEFARQYGIWIGSMGLLFWIIIFIAIMFVLAKQRNVSITQLAAPNGGFIDGSRQIAQESKGFLIGGIVLTIIGIAGIAIPSSGIVFNAKLSTILFITGILCIIIGPILIGVHVKKKKENEKNNNSSSTESKSK
jgi:hypothetical protein